MCKEIAATEPPKTTAPAKKWREEFEKKHPNVKAAAKPVTEDELRGIFDRLDAALDIFRQNRELAGGFVPPRNRDPGIAEPQRGVGRDHAEIRSAVGRGNHHGIGSEE
jgi:hypothetical protein